ncbi:MAG: TIGR03085 family metal-binding protein [Stackebrandtia sp.]
MSSIVRAEREALTGLLERLGPSAPTLCGDWTTADLAAHLVARERRPDSLPGLLLPGFGAWTEKVRRGLANQDYAKLIAMLRQPPWWAVTAAAAQFDLVEWFVHHEDVRRAAPGWQPRPLPRETGEALWSKELLTRLLLRGAHMAVTVSAPGYGRRTVGRGPIRATVTGGPGEIVLFCFGRQDHARVEVTGDRARKLRKAKLGL